MKNFVLPNIINGIHHLMAKLAAYTLNKKDTLVDIVTQLERKKQNFVHLKVLAK